MESDAQSLVKRLSAVIFLDDSRRNFAEHTFRTVHSLVTDKLKRGTAHRRLLLGRKGVGKTTLLNEAICLIEQHFPQVICIFESYGLSRFDRITDIISTQLGYSFNSADSHKRVVELEKELTRQGKYLVVIADEFQNCFRFEFDSVCNHIGDFFEFGEARDGRIHCIISGSSSVLRQLCFGKLPAHRAPQFPAYRGFDFNSTKYQPVWIYPFLQRADFEQVLQYFLPEEEISENLVIAWYLATSGNARLLSNVQSTMDANDIDSYAVSSKHMGQHSCFSIENQLLLSIFDVVSCTLYETNIVQGSETNLLAEAAELVRLVPVDSVLRALRRRSVNLKFPMPDPGEQRSCIYNLADDGLIIFTHSLIGFGSPLVYLDIIAHDKEVTAIEYVALRYPMSPK